MTVFLPHPFFFAAAAEHGAAIFFAEVLLLIAVGRLLGEFDAAHRTARLDRPIARWDHSGAERFWCDLAGGRNQAIFPPNSSDWQLLNTVSDIGVLLLLVFVQFIRNG